MQARDEYEKTIQETEAAYIKVSIFFPSGHSRPKLKRPNTHSLNRTRLNQHSHLVIF